MKRNTDIFGLFRNQPINSRVCKVKVEMRVTAAAAGQCLSTVSAVSSPHSLDHSPHTSASHDQRVKPISSLFTCTIESIVRHRQPQKHLCRSQSAPCPGPLPMTS